MKSLHPMWLKHFAKAILCISLFLSAAESQSQNNQGPNDPHALWTRKSGGTGFDRAEGIACEHNGNIYVAGCYNSASLSESGSFLNSFQGGAFDGYIMKLDRDNNVLWSVYAGGTGTDICTAVAVTPAGNVVLTGYTSSDNFGESASSSVFGGGSQDAFCCMYSPEGELIWSTYLGGSGDETGYDIAVDSDNNVYVAGNTNSADFYAPSAFQNAYGGGSLDGFITRLDPDGAINMFSYFGGTGTDELLDITTDQNGKVYFCGYTAGSAVLDNMSAHPYGGGNSDAFITCVDETSNISWAEYVGGNMADAYTNLTTDAAGHILVTGNTSSGPNVNMTGSEILTANNQDVMLSAYTENGTVVWNRFITGNNAENAKDIHIDVFGNIYLGGTTASNNLAVINAFQETSGGNIDNFLSKWNIDGEMNWLSYYGGSADEGFEHMSSDRFGKIMMSGFTFSSDFANETNNNLGQSDAIISRISDCANPEIVIHTNDDTLFCDGSSALLTVCGANHYEWMNGDTLNLTNVDTTMTCYVIGHNVEGCYGMSRYLQIESKELPTVTISADGPTTFCGEGEVTLTAAGAEEYSWNDEAQSTSESITVNTDHVFVVTGWGENGCTNSEIMEIIINELPEVVMSAAADTVCVSGAPVSLIGLPNGGMFSGPGIVNSTFDPYQAGGGIHQLTYSFTDENGCSATSDSVTIEVFYFPTVLFVANDTVCTFDAAFQLTGTPEGGTFSGDGVLDGFFHPELPGTGPQNITYSYVDFHGCINTDHDIIYVDPCIVESVSETSEQRFSVYPNPASDFVQISSTTSSYMKATIMESSGKIVQTLAGWNNFRISTEEFSAGYYYINIQTDTTHTTIPLVVVK